MNSFLSPAVLILSGCCSSRWGKSLSMPTAILSILVLAGLTLIWILSLTTSFCGNVCMCTPITIPKAEECNNNGDLFKVILEEIGKNRNNLWEHFTHIVKCKKALIRTQKNIWILPGFTDNNTLCGPEQVILFCDLGFQHLWNEAVGLDYL